MKTEELVQRFTIETYTSRSIGTGPTPDPKKKERAKRWRRRLLLWCAIAAALGGATTFLTWLVPLLVPLL